MNGGVLVFGFLIGFALVVWLCLKLVGVMAGRGWGTRGYDSQMIDLTNNASVALHGGSERGSND